MKILPLFIGLTFIYSTCLFCQSEIKLPGKICFGAENGHVFYDTLNANVIVQTILNCDSLDLAFTDSASAEQINLLISNCEESSTLNYGGNTYKVTTRYAFDSESFKIISRKAEYLDLPLPLSQNSNLGLIISLDDSSQFFKNRSKYSNGILRTIPEDYVISFISSVQMHDDTSQYILLVANSAHIETIDWDEFDREDVEILILKFENGDYDIKYTFEKIDPDLQFIFFQKLQNIDYLIIGYEYCYRDCGSELQFIPLTGRNNEEDIENCQQYLRF